VISWCTYPIVYVFPMMGISGPSSVVAIQLGYSVSDIISKCGVGLLIYQITINKSRNERAALESQIAEARIKIAVGKAETEQGCLPGQ